MDHNLKGLLHMASDFLINLEAKIGTIIAAEDPEAVKAEIIADVTAATADLTSANAALTTRVTELETALTDTVSHLAKGNIPAATTAATSVTLPTTADPAANTNTASVANTAS